MRVIYSYLFKLIWTNSRSWKTTAAGVSQIALAIGVFTGQLAGDEIPQDGGESLKNLLTVILALSGVNGILSRDANISSEAGKPPAHRGKLPALFPVFLVMGVTASLSSCAQLDQTGDQIGSVFQGLSFRTGIEGGGAIMEATVPPGYGIGTKFYGVTPFTSALPKEGPQFPDNLLFDVH